MCFLANVKKTNAWAGVIAALAFVISLSMGAIVAHALQSQLTAQAMGWLDTANRYLIYAAIGLLVVALRPARPALTLVAVLLMLGAIAFCGGLYGLALADWRLPALIPSGGLLLIAGWLGLALVGFKSCPAA